MTDDTQDVCGCCAGVAVASPAEVQNRPGLSALNYRVGDYGRFRHSLRARLSAYPELADLTTGAEQDFSLALLDACAAMGDVLTFYQERIANEHYLPTATERRSVLEMSDLVGYRLRPGVAASVWLAFTMESASTPGEAPESSLPEGVRVQSIPGPEETAQIFETVEAVRARAEWNAIRPRQTHFQTFDHNSSSLLLDGLVTDLKRGDGLILTTATGGSRLSLVTAVEADTKRQQTLVEIESVAQPGPQVFTTPFDLDIGIGPAPGLQPVAPPGLRPLSALPVTAARSPVAAVNTTTTTTATAGSVAPAATVGNQFGGMLDTVVSGIDLYAGAQLYGFDVFDLFAHLKASAPPPQGVLALRMRAGIFGHNAPRWDALPVSQRSGEYGPDPDHSGTDDPAWGYIPGPYRGRDTSWVEDNTLGSYPDPQNDDPFPTDRIYLDAAYSQLTPGSFIAIKSDAGALVYQIDQVDEISKSDFTLSAKVSRLILRFDDPQNTGLGNFDIRSSTVLGQSEQLPLARIPIETAVSGLQLELEGWIEGLYAGQKLILCGERSDLAGVQKCEPAQIDRVEYITEEEGYTRLTLTSELQHAYRRESVLIHANVALATHGESVSETLGNGDPRRSWQRFELKQPPLTYVSSADPDDAGARSTLEVRIDGIRWREVPDFYQADPTAHVFVTRKDDDGRTTLQFGDGKSGARPSAGTGNIEADYRKGIGASGNVRAEQISLLLSRPLGLKEVSNPLAASGGADAETLSEARQNVPLSVRTLGRVVSLADYADYARAFAGIAKAQAAWIWDGNRRVVVLSVAGTDGGAVEAGSPLHDNLLDAMQNGGDSSIAVALLSYRKGLVRISARLKIHPDYEDDAVIAAADSRLRERLSFGSRFLGDPLAASQVTTWIQEIDGVIAVDVDALYRALEPEDLHPLLFAALPQRTGNGLQAAELLTLDPGGLDLRVMT
jgi:hypothetical protein